MPAMEARRAGKNHHCDRCGGLIRQGTIYLLWTTFPNDDYSSWSVPVQGRGCGKCAAENTTQAELIQKRKRLEKNKAQARYLKRKKAAVE